MIGVLGDVIGLFLGGWFVVTCLANFVPAKSSLRARLGRHDVVGLIPDWALFVRPRVVDVLLLRRDVLGDGTLTTWREVEIAGPPHWYNFIWNPELGPNRAFLALADRALRNARRQSELQWIIPGQGTKSAIPDMLTVPYLAMLKYVSENSGPFVAATQFMLMEVRDLAITGSYGVSEPGAILFVSEIHAVVQGGESSP
jgi:hypothetical protein